MPPCNKFVKPLLPVGANVKISLTPVFSFFITRPFTPVKETVYDEPKAYWLKDCKSYSYISPLPIIRPASWNTPSICFVPVPEETAIVYPSEPLKFVMLSV